MLTLTWLIGSGGLSDKQIRVYNSSLGKCVLTSLIMNQQVLHAISHPQSPVKMWHVNLTARY